MVEERRASLELLLAFYMGAMGEELDLLEEIPAMSDEKLDYEVSKRGELYGWE